MSVFLCDRYLHFSSFSSSSTIHQYWNWRRKIFSGMMAFRALLYRFLCVHACDACLHILQYESVYVCVRPGTVCFTCMFSLVDATLHPWQPENTLIFPTLIVKGEAERTEKVCVFVSVCVWKKRWRRKRGEWKIYSTFWIKKRQKKKVWLSWGIRGMINLSSQRERWRESKWERKRQREGEVVKWPFCPPLQ